MKTISILGCGWLGKPLGQALSQTGWHVRGSTTREENMEAIRAVGIHPYLLTLDPVIEGDGKEEFFQVDILVISIPPKRKSEQTEMFLRQMKEVVKAIETGTVQQVIFISSTSVYPDLNRVVEEVDADPESYMVEAENIFLEQKRFHTIVLRMGGLIGPDRHPGKFLAGKKDVAGAHAPVNMVHLQDAVALIQTIVQHKPASGVFNVCAAQHPARKDFYAAAATSYHADPPVFSTVDDSDFKIVSSVKVRVQYAYAFRYDNLMEMLLDPEAWIKR